jgi:hypothetical protein
MNGENLKAMLTYNKTWIDNLEVRKQSAKWLKKNLITKEEHENVKRAYPTSYSQSIFLMRIGMFIFTLIVILGTTGLFGVATLGENAIGVQGLAYGIIAAFIATHFIRTRNYFRSGVIDALIYFSVFSFSMGICILISGNDFDFDLDPVIYLAASIPFAAFMAIYFADAFLALCVYASLFLINALLVMKIGTIGKMILPFEAIILSFCAYKWVDSIKNVEAYKYWHRLIATLRAAALTTFYLSGNYLVVRELSEALLKTTVAPGQDISLALFFYAWTIVVPILFIIYGLKQKDSLISRVGILMEVTGILCIRHYYSVLPLESALILAGIFLVVLARLSMYYLREPRNGITYLEDTEEDDELMTAIGSTAVSHVAGKSIHQEEPGKFGGGQSGGGGAGSNF